MGAPWPQPDHSDRHLRDGTTRPSGNVRALSGSELERRIQGGWEVWSDLLDDLLSTGGMLPSRELAGRVVAFFEDGYWRAEDARVEDLRRQMAAQRLRRCRNNDRLRGIR